VRASNKSYSANLFAIYLLTGSPFPVILQTVSAVLPAPAIEPAILAPTTISSYSTFPRTLKEAGISTTAILGQTAPASPAAPADPVSPVSPSPYFPILTQVNGTFTSGPGVGYESSFVALDGFVPLVQTPGKDLTYLQGRLLLSTDGGNPGGNLLVGYRRFNPANHSILGGYLGYDLRDSGKATFHQLGTGAEAIWPGFEARINGYLPIGDTRQTVDRQDFSSTNTSTSTALMGGASRFQGNSLLVDVTRTTTLNTTVSQFSRRQDQAALGGLDAEVGLKLWQWKPDGDLRSYLGMYYYAGANIGGFVGVRGRLVARVNQSAQVGLSIQGDPEFGTTASVTVGLTFPGVKRHSVPESNSNWARMGESVSRSNTVAITERTDTKVSSITTTSSSSTTSIEAALNPATGQPYVFQHVVLGNAGGNGTFESPVGTVAAALTVVPGDGNGIVYVQPGSNPGIPTFTIKDNVQMLSTGPIQPLATVQFGTVNLPLSGAGILPSVTGTVTMGNNTVLSGFAVTPPAGNTPIVANAVQTVTIRDNRAQASGNDTPGIRLQNVSGTALVRNNTVSTTGNTATFPTGAFGIFADITNTALSNLMVAGNTITNSGGAGHGISVTTRNTGAIATAIVSGNIINTTATSGLGILLLSLNTSSMANVSVVNNTITTSGVNAYGVSVNPRDTSSMANVSVSNNKITTAGGNSFGIIVNSRNSGSATTMTAADNTILTSGGSAFGIYVLPINTSVLTNTTLSGNSISTSGASAFGVYVIPQAGTSLPTLTLANNQILQSGFDNVRIANSSNQPICATITGNLAINPSGGGTNFALQSGVQPFRVVNLANLSLNNTGTFQFNGSSIPAAPFTNVATCP
jgi:hypothetical protein